MACIDIYEPGRLLTIPFLAEQIWLRVRGKQFLATEVYDFLLQVDDGQPLDGFFVASPHFCRIKKKNAWVDRVHLLGIGDAKTPWGWFYYGDKKRAADGRLTLRVPRATDPRGPDLIELDGFDLVSKHIDWFDGLGDDDSVEMMRALKKSLYRIKLDEPLESYGANRMWFRLLVEPATLDVFAPIPGTFQSVADLTSRALSLTTTVSCPLNVRQSLSTRLTELRNEHPGRGPEIDMLEKVLITEGFSKPSTSTRIEEHRILLSGFDVVVNLQCVPPTLAYHGALSAACRLPPFGRGDDVSNIDHHPEKACFVNSAFGGATHNAQNDLIAVARSYIEETDISQKTKDQLTQAITPSQFREGCFLIDKMVEIGLLTIDSDKMCRKVKDSDQNTKEKFCTLRRLYLDSTKFVAFREAQFAFADVHCFRLDFNASWTPRPALRWLLIATVGLFSFFGFALGVINLLLRIFR